MASAPKPYRKLPGRGAPCGIAIVSRYTLWLGDDHLLSVNWQGYSERYKRFYYRDIQSITICQTKRYAIGAIVWPLVLGLLTAFALWVESENPGVWIGFTIPGGALFLGLSLHLLRGPTCRVVLQTAVHTEELPSLNRVRVARKALARLQPLITAAQGEVTADMIATGLPPVPPVLQPALAKSRTTLSHESGLVHLLAFALLTGFGEWQTVDLVFTGFWASLGTLLWFAGTAVAVIVALVRQYRTDLPTALRRWTFVATGYGVLALVLGYIQYSIIIFGPLNALLQPDILTVLAKFDPFAEPVLLWTMATEAVLAVAIGLAGSLLALRWRRQSPTT